MTGKLSKSIIRQTSSREQYTSRLFGAGGGGARGSPEHVGANQRAFAGIWNRNREQDSAPLPPLVAGAWDSGLTSENGCLPAWPGEAGNADVPVEGIRQGPRGKERV